MPKFELSIPHSLQPDDARARLERATAKIESAYGAKCKWNDDRHLAVSRKGLDALVTIEPTRVHVNVSLGLLLVALAPAISAGLTKELKSLLASDPAGSANPAP